MTLVYFVSRLINLGLIPIFTDEAIYVRWSQIMAYDASLRYLPLIDGKPPLFMWLTSILMRFLSQVDPVVVGRLVAVASGYFGFLGVVFTAWQVFRNKKIAVLAGIFYLVVPFTFFYDRFGLADSLLAAFATWSLGLSVMLIRRPKLDLALLLGITIGLGLLTKTPAQFFLAYLPLTLVLFDFSSKERVKALLKWLGCVAIVVVFSQAIFSILRLFPLFHMISQKNMEFVVTPAEFLKTPLKFLIGNGTSLVNWEVVYLTIPIALLVIVTLLRISRVKLLLLAYFLIHFVFLAAVNKVIYPRFLLTFTPILLILAASGAVEIAKKRSSLIIISLIALGFSLFVDFKLITDPLNAPIPTADTTQYLNSWSAGYGVAQIRAFLKEESAQNKEVVVVTEGTFGLMPYSLEIYHKDYPNVEIIPYWPLPGEPDNNIRQLGSQYPVYVIMYQEKKEPTEWKPKLVAKYQQGVSLDYLRLYKAGF